MVHLRAEKLGHGQARQQVDGNVFFFFGAVQRRQEQFGQQQFPVRLFRRVASGRRGSVSHPRRCLVWLRSLGCEHSFQLAMAHDQPRHLRPRRLHEARTQGHVVPQVVDSDRKPFERKRRRSRNHLRQSLSVGLLAQTNDGKSRHREWLRIPGSY